MRLPNPFRRVSWKPKENILYRTWQKIPFFRDSQRIFEVNIVIRGKKFAGAFKVKGKTCTIILFPSSYLLLGRRKSRKFKKGMLRKSVTFQVPIEDVKFKKFNEYFNTIVKYGQQGEAGKITHYVAILKKLPIGIETPVEDLSNIS